jgi:hypothetical protein
MDIPSIQHFITIVGSTIFVALATWAVYYITTYKD